MISCSLQVKWQSINQPVSQKKPRYCLSPPQSTAVVQLNGVELKAYE